MSILWGSIVQADDASRIAALEKKIALLIKANQERSTRLSKLEELMRSLPGVKAQVERIVGEMPVVKAATTRLDMLDQRVTTIEKNSLDKRVQALENSMSRAGEVRSLSSRMETFAKQMAQCEQTTQQLTKQLQQLRQESARVEALQTLQTRLQAFDTKQRAIEALQKKLNTQLRQVVALEKGLVQITLLRQRVNNMERHLQSLPQATEDLRQIQEKLASLMTRMGKMERRLDDQKSLAERLTPLETKLPQIEGRLDKQMERLYHATLPKLQRQIDTQLSTLGRQCSKLAQQQEQLPKFQQRITSLESRLPQLEKKLTLVSGLSPELLNRLQKSTQTLEQRLQQLENSRDREQRLEKCISTVQASISSYSAKLEELEQLPSKILQVKQECTEKWIPLNNSLKQQAKKLAELEEGLTRLQKKIQPQWERLSTAVNSLRVKTERCSVVAKHCKELGSELARLKTQHQQAQRQLDQRINTLTSALEQCRQQCTKFKQSGGQESEGLAELRQQLEKIKKENETRVASVFQALIKTAADKKEFQKLGQRVQGLETLTSDLQEHHKELQKQNQVFQQSLQKLQERDQELQQAIVQEHDSFQNLSDIGMRLAADLLKLRTRFKKEMQSIMQDRQLDKKLADQRHANLSQRLDILHNRMLAQKERDDCLEGQIMSLRKVDEGLNARLQKLAAGAAKIRGHLVHIGRQMVQLFEQDILAPGEVGPQAPKAAAALKDVRLAKLCTHIGLRLGHKKMWRLCAVFLNQALALDSQATKAREFLDQHHGEIHCPTNMVYVPAGSFFKGSGDTMTKVTLPGFYIDRTEVTIKQYKRFMAAQGYNQKKYWSKQGWQWRTVNWIRAPYAWQAQLARGQDDYPVVGICWYEAQAYARWCGKALPTEDQWEKAARGQDRREFPWGNEWPVSLKNQPRQNHTVGLKRVATCLPDVSPYGVYDMGGNVAEWCAGSYANEPHLHPIRGGSWNTLWLHWRVHTRCGAWADSKSVRRGMATGFRCVKALPAK